MEQRRNAQYEIVKVRSRFYSEYLNTIKVLYVDPDTVGLELNYVAQHDSAEELEKRAVEYCRKYGYRAVKYRLLAGDGTLVEYGNIKERGVS